MLKQQPRSNYSSSFGWHWAIQLDFRACPGGVKEITDV
jgi:hypothetical protein